jgi:hypothetical protein
MKIVLLSGLQFCILKTPVQLRLHLSSILKELPVRLFLVYYSSLKAELILTLVIPHWPSSTWSSDIHPLSLSMPLETLMGRPSQISPSASHVLWIL